MWSTIIEGEGLESLTPSCSQWRTWKEEGGVKESCEGGATPLFGLHWETTASQDGQKVMG